MQAVMFHRRESRVSGPEARALGPVKLGGQSAAFRNGTIAPCSPAAALPGFKHFPVKRECAGALDFHVQQRAAVCWRGLEYDDLVAACPARHAGGILLAQPLDQNLHLSAHELLMLLRTMRIHHFEQPPLALLFLD